MPQTPLPRLLLLANFFSRNPKASLQDIIRYLDRHGFPVSSRTAERDIYRLRTQFRIDIDYDRASNIYTVTQGSIGHLNELCQMQSYYNTAGLLEKILNIGVKGVDVIDMESQGTVKGVNWLDEIFSAISNRKNIELLYKKFDSESEQPHDLSPWLLKYYQGRWYVVGEVEGQLRIFGVDRIHGITPSETGYVKCRKDPKAIFKDQIGIFYEDHDPVIVRFLATEMHSKYLTTLPMHVSQEKGPKAGKWVEYTLKVRINFELVQQFLMAGERVKVLEPPDLVSRMKEEIKKMYGYYFDTDK